MARSTYYQELERILRELQEKHGIPPLVPEFDEQDEQEPYREYYDGTE